MMQSHIIDIDGVFVGVAVRLDNGFRFIATDPSVEDIGETIWSGLGDIRRLGRSALAGTHAASVVTAPPEQQPRAPSPPTGTR
jgi:hypothetical protein